MIISHRVSKGNVIEYNISCKEDLLSFINECLKPKVEWLSIGDQLNLDYIYDSNEKITLKKWYSIWGPHLKPYSNQRTVQYWLIRGYTKEQATSNIKTLQSKAGQVFSNNVKNNPKKYSSMNPTQIGYWLKKGYTEDEAKNLISERQRTFSLDKCIAKWGLEEGTNRFNERNDKWKQSLSKSEGVTWTTADRNHRSLSKYESLIHLAIDYIEFSFLSDEVKSCYQTIINERIDSTDSLLDLLRGCSYKEMLVWSKLKPIQEFLNKSRFGIVEHWICSTPDEMKRSKWGNLYYYKDYYFQSTGEFVIGSFMLHNGIDFKMHKRYPVDDLLMYDFYLPKFDMYIEYCGRDLKSYKKKASILSDAGLNIQWEASVDKILEYLELLITS